MLTKVALKYNIPIKLFDKNITLNLLQIIKQFVVG